jgi:hypothetical protein
MEGVGKATRYAVNVPGGISLPSSLRQLLDLQFLHRVSLRRFASSPGACPAYCASWRMPSLSRHLLFI